jgi:hypothetical protein
MAFLIGKRQANHLGFLDGLLGAQMVKEGASKTSDVAGDGTTIATVLVQAIVGDRPGNGRIAQRGG